MMFPYKGAELQRKRWIVGASATALVGVVLVFLQVGEGLSYDLPFRFRTKIRDTNVVVVLEDRASLDQLGQTNWPPSRTVHARLVDRLNEEGAKTIVFDIGFHSSYPVDDAVFAKAIHSHSNVILSALPSNSRQQQGEAPGAAIMELLMPNDLLLTNAADYGLAIAQNSAAPDPVRKMANNRDPVTTVWKAAERSGALPPGEKPETERWINYFGPSPALDQVTLIEVLQQGEGHKLPPGLIHGKTVFVGFEPSARPASAEQDLFPTPYSLGRSSDRDHRDSNSRNFTPGVEVLATQFANLIRGDWLRRMGTATQCVVSGGFGLAACALLIFLGKRRVVFVAPSLLVALMIVTLYLQWNSGIWWNWLIPATVQIPMATLTAFLFPRLPLVAFISYRRKGGDAFAAALVQALRARGQDALMDIKDLSGGEFPLQLLDMVDRGPNFVLVLSAGSLDERITREDDWLRKEITHAFSKNKKIIPILLEGFDFSKCAPFPPGMERLGNCQCIAHHHDQWENTIDKLQKYMDAKGKGIAAPPQQA